MNQLLPDDFQVQYMINNMLIRVWELECVDRGGWKPSDVFGFSFERWRDFRYRKGDPTQTFPYIKSSGPPGDRESTKNHPKWKTVVKMKFVIKEDE